MGSTGGLLSLCLHFAFYLFCRIFVLYGMFELGRDVGLSLKTGVDLSLVS